jgi:hypothetical protein
LVSTALLLPIDGQNRFKLSKMANRMSRNGDIVCFLSNVASACFSLLPRNDAIVNTRFLGIHDALVPRPQQA